MAAYSVVITFLLGFISLEFVTAQDRWGGFNEGMQRLGYVYENANQDQLGKPVDPAQEVVAEPPTLGPIGTIIASTATDLANTIVGACPNMCNEILARVTAINPPIGSFMQAFINCEDSCGFFEGAVNFSLNKMKNCRILTWF